MFRGGSATVYRGTIPSSGRRVAVKVLRCNLATDEESIAHVLNEIHIWSKLRHKNILPFFGISVEFEYTVSMISEWVNRGNARDYVQNTRNDPRPLLLDIAKGIQYLHTHEKPIYHGDLKGTNVVIADNGHALLTDFGLSYLVNSSLSMPVRRALGGSWNWIAPEYLDGSQDTEGNKPTAEGDIWAFGMTALNPFHDHARSMASLVNRIVQGPPSRPADEATCYRMTHEWWNICYACWQDGPALRPKISRIITRIQATQVMCCYSISFIVFQHAIAAGSPVMLFLIMSTYASKHSVTCSGC
ncbi:hypothetical protein ID866_3004 [Astraeus odoratus]|nr:hypothetical protein ID866_3004 [Astraeus odoratus]